MDDDFLMTQTNLWDTDGDGIADNADDDADNDGVNNLNDKLAFDKRA